MSRRVALGIIGAALALRVMFPVEQCRGNGAVLLPVSVWTDSAGASATLAAGVAYLESRQQEVDNELLRSLPQPPLGYALDKDYTFNAVWNAFRDGPPRWLDSIYMNVRADAVMNLPPRLVARGMVIDAVDKAFQVAVAKVKAMTPVPWWQRLRVGWIGNQCPPSVGITALQSLLLAGAFWYVHAQWK
jgi:hypothetical protein